MSALAFQIAPDLEAHEPPEARGLRRDGVRMLVAHKRDGRVEHRTFAEVPDLLSPGDVLVVNVSATVPAALPARPAAPRAAAACECTSPRARRISMTTGGWSRSAAPTARVRRGWPWGSA